jgi:3-oxoacyl-[acyl-carrier-protein] synthase-3
MPGVRVAGVSYQLGSGVESNDALSADQPLWDLGAIEGTTGVCARRIAPPDQCASDLAVEAAEAALAEWPKPREEIDALIFCTQSPDYLLPTTACLVQERLKLPTSTAAFDINMGCSGYVYGLAIASAMLTCGLAKNALLLNADTYSKFIDHADRTCRPLFGDGAAATIIEVTDGENRVGPFDLGTDGRGKDHLILCGSGTRGLRRDPGGRPAGSEATGRPVLRMNGAEVMMFTMRTVPGTVSALLRKGGIGKDDVDLYVFHQASRKVLDNLVRHLGVPEEKVFRGFAEIGNTVSASIPIALKQAQQQGRLEVGQRLALVGFGVGFSWGSCLLRWG